MACPRVGQGGRCEIRSWLWARALLPRVGQGGRERVVGYRAGCGRGPCCRWARGSASKCASPVGPLRPSLPHPTSPPPRTRADIAHRNATPELQGVWHQWGEDGTLRLLTQVRQAGLAALTGSHCVGNAVPTVQVWQRRIGRGARSPGRAVPQGPRKPARALAARPARRRPLSRMLLRRGAPRGPYGPRSPPPTTVGSCAWR